MQKYQPIEIEKSCQNISLFETENRKTIVENFILIKVWLQRQVHEKLKIKCVNIALNDYGRILNKISSHLAYKTVVSGNDNYFHINDFPNALKTNITITFQHTYSLVSHYTAPRRSSNDKVTTVLQQRKETNFVGTSVY